MYRVPLWLPDVKLTYYAVKFKYWGILAGVCKIRTSQTCSTAMWYSTRYCNQRFYPIVSRYCPGLGAGIKGPGVCLGQEYCCWTSFSEHILLNRLLTMLASCHSPWSPYGFQTSPPSIHTSDTSNQLSSFPTSRQMLAQQSTVVSFFLAFESHLGARDDHYTWPNLMSYHPGSDVHALATSTTHPHLVSVVWRWASLDDCSRHPMNPGQPNLNILLYLPHLGQWLLPRLPKRHVLNDEMILRLLDGLTDTNV